MDDPLFEERSIGELETALIGLRESREVLHDRMRRIDIDRRENAPEESVENDLRVAYKRPDAAPEAFEEEVERRRDD